MTWYPESFTRVAMNDMNMRADPYRGYPGRTYRFYIGHTVFGFGQGLSYTSYAYKFVSAPSKLNLVRSIDTIPSKSIPRRRREEVNYIHTEELDTCDSLRFQVEISVTNVGDMDGSHVVLLFSRVPKIEQGTPEKQLIGFSRLHTVSGRATETSIMVDPCEHFSFADEEGKRIMPLGDHTLMLEDVLHYISVES